MRQQTKFIHIEIPDGIELPEIGHEIGDITKFTTPVMVRVTETRIANDANEGDFSVKKSRVMTIGFMAILPQE